MAVVKEVECHVIVLGDHVANRDKVRVGSRLAPAAPRLHKYCA